MSYRYNQVKSRPIAAWLLSDASPFDEHSGSGATANTSYGTLSTTAPLVAGAAYSTIFSDTAGGRFDNRVYKVGMEDKTFALEAWVFPLTTGTQQILSRNGQMNGLWIDGNVVHFSTNYASSGTCDTFFDLGLQRAAHVVGQHTSKYNELWVDGVLVMRTDLTDAQKDDVYLAASSEDLFCGSGSPGGARIALNGIAIYNSITPEQVAANFKAGRAVIPQASIPSQFSGIPLYLDAGTGSVYFERNFVKKVDFDQGAYDSIDTTNPEYIRPLISNSVTVAGTWTVAVPLDTADVTSCYGVLAEWSGKSITVEGRIDNGSWSTLTSGRLISAITNGFTTTGKILEIRVTFPAGQADGSSYLESLTLVGFRNNLLDSTELRNITLGYPAVARKDYEPITYRQDNGISVNGGTVTIGPDTAEVPTPTLTLEYWCRVLDGTAALSGLNTPNTYYVNGVQSGPFTAGEWTLVHYVLPANQTAPIVFSGNLVLGQVALYPTALTAADIDHIWKSYTGAPVITFPDTGTIGIVEYDVKMYLNDWSIESG